MSSTPGVTAMTVGKSAVRWTILVVKPSLIAINYVDRALLPVAMPLISRVFNIGPAMAELILSSFFWTYALMQIPGGMLAARYKPRIVIAPATVFWGFFQALAAICTRRMASTSSRWAVRVPPLHHATKLPV